MFSKLLFCSLLFLHCFVASHSFLFGLARLNRRFNRTTKIGARQRVLNSHKRMPRYMIQLYKELTTGDDGGFVKKKMPYQANAIRGINSAVSKLSKASMKIYFTLGYFQDRVTITRDELHLYMSPPENPLERNIFKPYILSLRDIHTNQLIREFKVPAFNQGWQVLSLKRWTNKWVKNPSTNKGVTLTIYRGRSKKPAHSNPFVNFPRGNDPYLILFASESVRSLVTWRFLIENALNSVAGTAKSRVPRDMSQQSQCPAVKRSMNLANTKIDEHRFIIEPKVHKMTSCTKACITRPVFPSSSNRPRNGAIAKYCCLPTRRRDLAVLIKDPTHEMVTFEILKNYVPANCMWAQQ